MLSFSQRYTVENPGLIRQDALCFWITTLFLSCYYQLSSTISINSFTLLVCNILIGLPHGASDFLELQKRCSGKKYILFGYLLSYCATALICFLAWFWQPRLALLVFLCISAYHFGGDWEKSCHFRRLSIGLGLLSIPCIHHSDLCQSIFYQLTFGQTHLSNLYYTHFICIIVASAAVLSRIKQQPWVFIEFFSLNILGYYAEPLTFFTVYFCSLHSARHIYHYKSQYQFTWYSSIQLLAITALTFTILAISHMFLLAIEKNVIQELAGFKTLFILLFALTVPHVILTAANPNQEDQASSVVNA